MAVIAGHAFHRLKLCSVLTICNSGTIDRIDFRDANSMRLLGFDAHALRLAGFSDIDVLTAGYTASELRDASFTAEELREVGLAESTLRVVGFQLEQQVSSAW